MRSPRPPPAKSETDRARLRDALGPEPPTARELSGAVGMSEKEVLAHLEHLQRSLEAAGAPLRVRPARCRKCDFAFEGRDRLTAPSRCPQCRGERILPPAFGL